MKLSLICEKNALMLNRDQEQFVKETVAEVGDWLNGLSPEQRAQIPIIPIDHIAFEEFPVVYQREVYGSRDKRGTQMTHDVIVHVGLQIGSMGGTGATHESKPHILISVNKHREDDEFYIPHDIESVVRHELVHVFDPKRMRVPDMWRWATGKDGKDVEYPARPWEQDAGMYERAMRRVRMIIKNGGKLEKVIPSDWWERTWAKDPKQWRKYIVTIYKLWQRENHGNNELPTGSVAQ